MPTIFILLALCALVLSPFSTAQETSQDNGLSPYTASYQSKLKGFNVTMKRTLRIEGDTLTLSMDASKFMFAINEKSKMRVVEGQFQPLNFVHQRKGLGDRHNKDLLFNWQTKTVSDRLNPDREALGLEDASLDKLGYHAKFRSQLLSKDRQARYEFNVADGKRLKLYAYDFIKEEIIETPLGKLKALKFKRDRGDSKRQTYIWFARDWDYLLARVDQIEREGEKPETMVLLGAEINGRQVKGLN